MYFLFFVQVELPDLHGHFVEHGVEPHMFASQWFLTLFTAKFPLPLVYRIIDIILCDVRRRKEMEMK